MKQGILFRLTVPDILYIFDACKKKINSGTGTVMKKIILTIVILTAFSTVLPKNITVVFSGSNNGYYRDCG